MTICSQLIGLEAETAHHGVVVPKEEERTKGQTIRVTHGRLSRPVTLDVWHRRRYAWHGSS
jgi:hypothetical protein